MRASEKVLEWIEAYIEKNRLGVGDALPRECDIMQETGLSRTSVRDALAVLKALGIIQSKRRGGIRIIRDPVMLGLRHYFAEQYDDSALYEDVLEFRAAMEWGLGSLILKRITPPTIKALREVVNKVAQMTADSSVEDISRAEIEFHRILTNGCGNQLAGLFVHLYEPIFNCCWTMGRDRIPPEAANGRFWISKHEGMVDALEAGDSDLFLRLLHDHTDPYF